jgi:hypothetical protein
MIDRLTVMRDGISNSVMDDEKSKKQKRSDHTYTTVLAPVQNG